MKTVLESTGDAFRLLKDLGAPNMLIGHSIIVLEVAEELVQKLDDIKDKVDFEFIKIGSLLHDIGKIVHMKEIYDSNSDFHEREGMNILLKLGVNRKIANCCLSHGNYNDMECSTEELLIALAHMVMGFPANQESMWVDASTL